MKAILVVALISGLASVASLIEADTPIAGFTTVEMAEVASQDRIDPVMKWIKLRDAQRNKAILVMPYGVAFNYAEEEAGETTMLESESGARWVVRFNKLNVIGVKRNDVEMPLDGSYRNSKSFGSR